MDKDTSEKEVDLRYGANRVLGLSSYAGGIIVLCLLVFSYFDSSVPPSLNEIGLGLLVVFALFGLGYTTGRRKG